MLLRGVITKFMPQVFFNPLQRIFDIFPFFNMYRLFVFLNIKFIKPKLTILLLETTNACNASCIMCPRELMTRNISIMKEDLYRKIIDEAKSLGVEEVHLQNFGEPLLDRDLAARIAYAKKNSVKTALFTNGSLLNAALSKDLILSGLDQMYISIDASREDIYNKIRIGLDFNQVEKNITDFMRVKKELKKNKPFVTLVFTQSFQEDKEAQDFVNKWQHTVDKVYIKKAHDWKGAKSAYNRKYLPFNFWPCEYLWKSLTILWDGQATICCVDFDGEVNLGNLNTDSIKSIWRGRMLNFYRECHMKNERKFLKVCSCCRLNKPWTI